MLYYNPLSNINMCVLFKDVEEFCMQEDHNYYKVQTLVQAKGTPIMQNVLGKSEAIKVII